MRRLSKKQQAYCFWKLASTIRTGARAISGEEILRRINYELLNYIWDDDILMRFSELQTIAYKAIRTNSYAAKENNRLLRLTSKF